MTWLVWRQHRTQAAVGAAVLAAFALLLLITGQQMASQFHSFVTSCTAADDCQWPANDLILGNRIVSFLAELTLAVPAVIGMFWGAPLIAREIETGTSQFTWMQSVTRKRWLAVKIGWLLLAALAWGGAVSALVTWWSGPRNAAYLNAFNPGAFDVQGSVPAAYALFAMALGIAAGALIRRSLPALAVTLGGFFTVRLAVMIWVRPHYMAAVTTTYGLTENFLPKGAFWLYAQGTLTPSGPVGQSNSLIGSSGPAFGLAGVPVGKMPAPCRNLMPSPGSAPGNPAKGAHNVISCLAGHGYRGYMTYQPAGRYWAFQGIETGLFVLLAAALIATAAIVVLRRDA